MISDIATIKSMIKVMRDSGMTFQEISDKLKSEYGISKSRQAIHGLYTRACEGDKSSLSEDEAKLICHVANIYCLGYNMAKTTDILNSLGISVNYSKVNKIIHSNENYIRSINETLVTRLKEMMASGYSLDAVKASLSYMGVPIIDKKLSAITGLAIKDIVYDYTVKSLVRAYKVCGDKDEIKALCQEYNIQFNSIEKHLDK